LALDAISKYSPIQDPEKAREVYCGSTNQL
jgi:hypothetical protein